MSVYPEQGTPMDPDSHPAANMPYATVPHDGTEFPPTLPYIKLQQPNQMLKDRQKAGKTPTS